MKEEFEKPTMHIVGHIGPLTNDEIAALPDNELAEYLMDHHFAEKAKRYKANPDYILRQIGGECVLVAVGDYGSAGNRIISLSETAACIYEQYAQPKTTGDVLQAVKEIYEADARMEADIEEYTRKFLENDLIREE